MYSIYIYIMIYLPKKTQIVHQNISLRIRDVQPDVPIEIKIKWHWGMAKMSSQT